MGFTNNNNSAERKIYVNIYDGKFAVRSKEKVEGTVTRISENKQTKEKKEIHEFYYDSLTGILKSVTCEKNEKLRAYQYVIIVEEVGDIYCISIPTDSTYGDSFASKLMGVKNNKEITITPYNFLDKVKKDKNGNPKKITGVTLIQDGVKIPRQYSVEDPKGMPEYKSDMNEAKWQIYNIELREFFKEECFKWARLNMEKVKPEEKSANVSSTVDAKNKAIAKATENAKAVEVVGSPSGDDDNDGLPF